MSNVSAEKKKAEALIRMKELRINYQAIKHFDELGKISLSKPPLGTFVWIEGEDLERVREFEKRYNVLVFIAIRNFTTNGILDSYLFVSDYPEEWANDRKLLKEGEVTAYVYNHDTPYCSEVGNIGVTLTATLGLCRIW